MKLNQLIEELVEISEAWPDSNLNTVEIWLNGDLFKLSNIDVLVSSEDKVSDIHLNAEPY